MYRRCYLALLYLLAACANDPPTTEFSAERAEAVTEVVPESVAVKEAPPEYAEALVYFARGEYAVASGLCQNALATRPDFVECYRIVAAALAVGGEADRAEGLYRRALALHADYAVLHNDLACLYVLQGRQQQALAHLTKAVELAPGAAFIHYNLGRVQDSLGYYRQAKQAYSRALVADAEDARIHAALGRLYLMQGRADAEVYLQDALALNPENPEAHYGLGQLRSQQGRDEQAIRHFERLLARDAEHADAWYGLGQAYAKISKHEKSRAALARFAVLQGHPPRDLELILSNPARAYTSGKVQDSIVQEPAADATLPTPAVHRRFVDITAHSGVDFVHTHGASGEYYIAETLGAGVCAADFDGDGLADVYLVDGHSLPESTGEGNRLYRNNGRSFSWVAASGAEDGGYGMGCAVADYDADGDLDLYASNWGANALYRNDGALHFTLVDQGVANEAWSTSVAFFDYDLDGDLDLYAVNYLAFELSDNEICEAPVRDYCGPDAYPGQSDVLYRNDGQGYVDVTGAAALYNEAGKGLGVATSDYDADGDVDLYVANDGVANFLYRNDGQGIFADQSLTSATAYNESGKAEAGMGVAFGDYDGDQRPDIFVTNLAYETNTLYRNEGDGSFADRTNATGLAEGSLRRVGFGAHFFDYDHDGDEDLFTANGHILAHIEMLSGVITHAQANQLWRNDGGTFSDVSAFIERRVSRGSALADWDLDGDLDLVVSNNGGRAVLLRNDGDEGKHWLQVVLPAARGVGAKVWVEAGGRVQEREFGMAGGYLSQGELVAHFGLGAAQRALVRVVWPDGRETRVGEVVADRRVGVD